MAKSGDGEDKGTSFDLERFRKLLQLMEKFGVTEVNLQNEAESWKIRRGPKTIGLSPEAAGMTFAMPPSAHATQPPVATAAPTAPAEAPAGITINAPTVGTFYVAPTPDDEPFVKVGSVVASDTTVCIIEAMKVFNPIQAEKSGRIVEILVENGSPVEFGQPLFRLEPA